MADEQTQLWVSRLRDEIQSHDRYNARQIFYIDDEEGLEETKWITECVDEVVHNITGKKRSNIHLFVNQKPGVSFKSHKDDLDVYLYVVKGKKKVNVEGEDKIAYADEGVFIKEGQYHYVDNEADTWGLSIGVV